VNLKATYPFDRYRAVGGKRQYRIFRDPEARKVLPWTLTVRDLGDDDVYVHIHHGTYRTDDDAKRAAEQWEGPPP
jgi:hypothetical protein